MHDLTPAARHWIAQATGLEAAALRLTGMRGSTSATLYLVTGSEQPSKRYVLRLYTLSSWLEAEPDLARHEAAALVEAANTGLPVPELLAYLPGPSREDGADPVGFSVPAVLMSHLPGRAKPLPQDEDAWLRELARPLVAVHEHPAPGFGWSHGSWVEPENVTVPPWTERPREWEAAVAAYQRWRPDANERTFLHRDYHPMNLLFEGSGAGVRTAGVVDWVNACRGPAAADVSHCRGNLLQLKGPAAASAFLEHYRELRGGFDYDPMWDLEAVFNHGPDPRFYPPWREFGVTPVPEREARRRLEEHMRRALAGGPAGHQVLGPLEHGVPTQMREAEQVVVADGVADRGAAGAERAALTSHSHASGLDRRPHLSSLVDSLTALTVMEMSAWSARSKSIGFDSRGDPSGASVPLGGRGHRSGACGRLRPAPHAISVHARCVPGPAAVPLPVVTTA